MNNPLLKFLIALIELFFMGVLSFPAMVIGYLSCWVAGGFRLGMLIHQKAHGND